MQARCGRWFRAWLGFRRNPLAMTGLGIVLLLVLMAIFAPLIADRQAATLQVLAGPAAAGELAASGSAPTSWAATSSPAWSSARASRSPSSPWWA